MKGASLLCVGVRIGQENGSYTKIKEANKDEVPYRHHVTLLKIWPDSTLEGSGCFLAQSYWKVLFPDLVLVR